MGQNALKIKWRVQPDATCTTAVQLKMFSAEYPTARYSLVAASPKSGRIHQIRRHLARQGHPIIGDVQHGASRHNNYFGKRWEKKLLLFSRKLQFLHPLSGNIEPPQLFGH